MATVTEELQEEFLTTLRRGQEVALDAIRTVVDSVHVLTPRFPAVSLPLADRLPKPEEVVASGYDFAEALLRNQRKFADDMIKAASPLLPAGEERLAAS